MRVDVLTRDMAEHLAALAHLLRSDLANRTGCPTWDTAGILKQLREISRFPAEDACLAVIRAAVDQGAATPGVIPALDGPHWVERLSQRSAPRNPLPHEECPIHPGQYRLSCSYRPACGPPKTGRPETQDRVSRVDELREAHRLAKAGLCSHGVAPDHCHENHEAPEEAPA